LTRRRASPIPTRSWSRKKTAVEEQAYRAGSSPASNALTYPVSNAPSARRPASTTRAAACSPVEGLANRTNPVRS
jgi:hypothetical protein